MKVNGSVRNLGKLQTRVISRDRVEAVEAGTDSIMGSWL